MRGKVTGSPGGGSICPKQVRTGEARLLFYGLRETKDIKTIALFLV